MENIDVEKIMSDIRSEIADKHYEKSEITYAEAIANLDGSDLDNCYRKRELEKRIEYLQSHEINPVFYDIKGNKIKSFLMKAYRRPHLYMFWPAFKYVDANVVNTAEALKQVKNYIDGSENLKKLPDRTEKLEALAKAQNDTIVSQQKEIEALNAKLAEQDKTIESLRISIEKIKMRMDK